MYRIIFLLLITSASFNCFANHTPKEWEIIVFSGGNKYKGVLKKVTDSSVVILVKEGFADEIVYREIDKIKLRPLKSKAGQRLLGFFTGGIIGGVLTGTILSAGRSGEPRAMAGVVGGIAGGLLFGIAGALLAPAISKMISTKKIVIQHNTGSYVSLKQKLLTYCR